MVDLRGRKADEAITAEMLTSRLPGAIDGQWILLATGFGDKRAKSDEWLNHPPVLSAEAARWLVEKGAGRGN